MTYPHDHLAIGLAGRIARPYAVGYRFRWMDQMTFDHFEFQENAIALARILETYKDVVTITRWSALREPEYLMSTPVPGWRQVTYFHGELTVCGDCGNSGTAVNWINDHTCN